MPIKGLTLSHSARTQVSFWHAYNARPRIRTSAPCCACLLDSFRWYSGAYPRRDNQWRWSSCQKKVNHTRTNRGVFIHGCHTFYGFCMGKIGQNPKIGHLWRPVAPQPYVVQKSWPDLGNSFALGLQRGVNSVEERTRGSHTTKSSHHQFQSRFESDLNWFKHCMIRFRWCVICYCITASCLI